MNQLVFDRVSATYGVSVAIRDVSARIDPGTVVGIIGPNGSGKSTLIKAVAGIVPLSTGAIRIGNEPLQQRHTRIAYVPQVEDIRWDFPISALDAVVMGRYRAVGWLRRPGQKDLELAAAALERLGLGDMGDRHISQFSGGQQQRIFLARTLVQDPEIVLLDEPMTGVDVANQEIINEIIAEFTGRGTIVLIATHDLDEVQEISDSVMLLNCEMIAYGPTATTFTPDNVRAAFGGHIAVFTS